MADRVVRRGEDAPVERATSEPGEKRDTGAAGPSRSEEDTADLAADPDTVRVMADVAAERAAAASGEPRRKGHRRGRGGQGGTETR